jgi:diguanylate cyclase (GGDEF)-like protein
MMLVGTDGIVRAWAPTRSHAIGFRLKEKALFDADAIADHGSYIAQSEVDGAQRISSYRRFEDYPLLVVVGEDSKQVFAAYQYSFSRYMAGGAVFTVLILTVGFVMTRDKLRLVSSQQALSDTLENINQGIIMVDAQRRVPVINRKVTELLGLPADLVARLRNFDDILKWQLDQGEFGAGGDATSGFRSFVERGGIDAHPMYERTRANGTVLEIRTNLLTDGRTVRTYTDITERKRSEAQITFLAHHDALTSLANRAAFHSGLEQSLGFAAPNAGKFAVLCLDLDRFKLVNDLHGHATGDILLQQVAERLRKTVRGEDLVARLGGDEFAILQSDVHQPEAAVRLANRMVHCLAEPFEIDGRLLSVGTSIGVALYPSHGLSANTLMKNADAALYRAKESGRSIFRVFDPAMNIRVHERRLLEKDLRAALSEGQFALFYQPIWDVERDRLLGFEALLRWLHPERGLIPPSEFIPLAEEIGLIRQIGIWVLKAACTAACRWPADIRLSVNLSPIQFIDDDLPEQVKDVVRQAGLAPNRLELEITESVLIEDGERVLDLIRRLRECGVSIALDDFGAGYSSLSYLRRFPFDTIKIDRSFVQAIVESKTTYAIVGSLITLGRNLGIQVVAEGVETKAQLDVLQRLHCRYIQGFLLGSPVAVIELPRLLAANTLDALRVA